MIKKIKKLDISSPLNCRANLTNYKDKYKTVIVDGEERKVKVSSINLMFRAHISDSRAYESINLMERWFKVLGNYLFWFEFSKKIKNCLFTDKVELITHRHFFDYLEGSYEVNINGEIVVFTLKKLNENLHMNQVHYEVDFDYTKEYHQFIFSEAQKKLASMVEERASWFREGLIEHFNLMVENQIPMMQRTFKMYQDEELKYSSTVNVLETTEITEFGDEIKALREALPIAFKRNLTLTELERVFVSRKGYLGSCEAIINHLTEGIPDFFLINDENPIFRLEGSIKEKGLINLKTFFELKEKYIFEGNTTNFLSSIKEIK